MLKFNPERMKLSTNKLRVLKVCQKPQGKNYVSGFNLQGNYLNKNDFNTGDTVYVHIQKGRIVISKTLEDL